MDGGGVNLDEQQISHWRDDLLANGHFSTEQVPMRLG